MQQSTSKGLMVLGVLLAVGMSVSAFIFGSQAKNIGAAKQTITVKGLAEQNITSTSAQWRIKVKARGDTFAEALAALRRERPALEHFLGEYGFAKDELTADTESVSPHMETETNAKGDEVQVQRGFESSESLYVNTEDLEAVKKSPRQTD